ncbi:uncharacterized protein LOC110029019 isoform X2 [Phalaenopsis equestris]|uniref:uncharacterized protein LOC110029019 isoform X2 n=1 Tax=Phalaenopsis equestris TaxID=78828 RepID=UPI0009E3B187|nr:uncharacterized protein LOC110029019 isoform X2 [Phalaenopsis equestris]
MGSPAAARASSSPQRNQQRLPGTTEQVRVKRETIQTVLDQCQRALKLLEDPDLIVDAEPDVNFSVEGKEEPPLSFSTADSDADADALCEMVKSRVESQSFLEKLGSTHISVSQSDSAWEMVGTADLWEKKQFGAENENDNDGFVLVNQEDIVEGIVSFMAAYLLSLKEAKDLAPNQLQKALRKTFSVKKEKSKLMKAWEGSQVIYNVTSWGATAVGIYQNPAIIKAASVAILSSYRAVSKFL